MTDRAIGINKLIEDAAEIKHRDEINNNQLESSLAILEEEIEQVITNIDQ